MSLVFTYLLLEDLQQTPWTKDEASGNEIRELQYDITVKTTIGTKKAGCQEKQVENDKDGV